MAIFFWGEIRDIKNLQLNMFNSKSLIPGTFFPVPKNVCLTNNV